jgi:hypothetical protein
MNAANMQLSTGSFNVPWDLHPRSLHSEFSHNTDVLFTHRSVEAEAKAKGRGDTLIPSLGEVGVWESSDYGLGGGICKHVLRDGTAAEVVGRLCVGEGSAPAERNASIAAAIASAEARHAGRRQGLRHVHEEAKRWRLIGEPRTPHRKLVAADSEEARMWQQGRGVRGGWRGQRSKGGGGGKRRGGKSKGGGGGGRKRWRMSNSP